MSRYLIREFCMLKPACIALSITAFSYGFGGQVAQAGWSDAASGLTLGASSLVISVKKHKNDDDDDDDDSGNKHKANNKGKHKKHDDKDHKANEQPTSGGGGKTPAESSSGEGKCNVLIGDYGGC
jgi:hypothetical protein